MISVSHERVAFSNEAGGLLEVRCLNDRSRRNKEIVSLLIEDLVNSGGDE
jgi:hypothetical protein